MNYPLFFLSLSSLFFFVVNELCYFEVASFVCSLSVSVCLCGGRRECEKARVSEWDGCLSTMQARSLTFCIVEILKPFSVGHLVYFTSELSSLSLQCCCFTFATEENAIDMCCLLVLCANNSLQGCLL